MHQHAAHLRQDDQSLRQALSEVARVGILERLAEQRLTWFPDIGVGYYPVSGFPYDRSYFDKYVAYRDTELGRELTKARVAMVYRHYHGPLLDVGIGCGAFCDARMGTKGFDVNMTAVAWLKQRELYLDPYRKGFSYPAVSLWDVIEHMADFSRLLRKVNSWVFLATPIFRNAEHVLGSKHFRPDEHYWYFTHKGLMTVMDLLGFDMVEHNADETALGREDIGSYAFKRR